MKRRKFVVATAAATFVAGCLGGDGSADGPDGTDERAENGDGTPDESTPDGDDGGTDGATDTPGDSTDRDDGTTEATAADGTDEAEGTAAGDGGASDLEPPAGDADPEALLPVARDGWEQTETGPQPEGEAGVYAVYERQGSEGYQIAVIRWGSRERAVEEAGTFESYTAITYVVIGTFSFVAYDNGSGQDPYELLGHSPALTAAYAENNDLIS